MKTLKDLFDLIAQATNENCPDSRTWFFSFSGHVNTLDITYYSTGWDVDKEHLREQIKEYLTEEGIQATYWFIKTRLRGF